MNTRDFINTLLFGGDICDDYKGRMAKAVTKSEIAKILADVNGSTFVCSQIAKGIELDYADAKVFMGRNLNDRQFEYPSENGAYTSRVYCDFKGKIVVDSTQITLLGSDVDIIIPQFHVALINKDINSACRIKCEDHAKAICTYWGDKPIVVSGNVKMVKGE